jgi:hypothetical protein
MPYPSDTLLPSDATFPSFHPEQIVLDPSEVADFRSELPINADVIRVRAEGVDWGNAEIQAYMADQSRGSSPVDFRVPNRTVTIPIVVRASDAYTFNEARRQLQNKVALFQREGGWIKRVLAGGVRVLYGEVVNASLKMSADWLSAYRDADIGVELVLELLPDFFGDEVDLGTFSETTDAALVFTVTDVAGDYPARCRIVVDEADGDRQRGLFWGIRSRHYSPLATAQLRYEADALTPLGAAGTASGLVFLTSPPPLWTPIMSTDLAGTGPLTHKGGYRVLARAKTVDSEDEAYLRLVWGGPDLALVSENSPARLGYTETGFAVVDLGEVRLDPATAGTHRWRGQIQGKSTTASQIQIDKLWFVPIDEAAGRLSAPLQPVSTNPATVRDLFNQAAGTLNGGTVGTGGGTWAVTRDGGAADFTVDATNHQLAVAGTADGWRGAVAGTATLTSCLVSLDFYWTAYDEDMPPYVALRARWVDASNSIRAAFVPELGYVWIERLTSPSTGAIHAIAPQGRIPPDMWHTARLLVTADGFVACWLSPRGALPGAPACQGYIAAAATGGALASGRVGFDDSWFGSGAMFRLFDNFEAAAVDPDAVIHPSQSVQIATGGVVREDASGVGYGPVLKATGDLPRLPPSGYEGRTVELIVKASRGDLDGLSDLAVDDISAKVYYRPSWLFVP